MEAEAFLPRPGRDMASPGGDAFGGAGPRGGGDGAGRDGFSEFGAGALVLGEGGDGAHAVPDEWREEARPEYFAGMEEMLVYFEGAVVAIVNYSRQDTEAIRNELRMLGARVRDRYTPDCTHLMTPYQVGPDFETALADGKIVVSYAWLEDCLTARRVLPHTDKVLYAPIHDENGVPGMENVVVSITGYKGPIRSDIRELIEASGATFNQNFTKKTTHLVCYRAESEVYAKALLFKLEGQPLEIVNHSWVEDCVKKWRRMPEHSELYRKLGVEVDFEERLEAEKRLRIDVEAQLEEEERARRNLQELLEAEEKSRKELHMQLMDEERMRLALKTRLDGEGANRDALQTQFQRSRGDIDALQALLTQSEASRGALEERIAGLEDERRNLTLQLEDAQRQQTMLQSQFARSRQDLLTQLEARLNSIEQLRAELDNEQKSHADTNQKLEEEKRATKQVADKLLGAEKQIKGYQEQLAQASREKSALEKQLDAERKSRLHILSDFESERKQREHLIKQLEAEQKLRQSLQKAVATKEELRLKAEEEIERLNQDIQEMMDEIDRLKTFEPPERDEDARIQVKLFLDEEIRFLEVEPDVSYEELTIAVGKILVESYVIKFEDAEKHFIALKNSEDLRIAIRSYEKGEFQYVKLILEKAGEKKRGLFGFGRKKRPEEIAAAAGGKKEEDDYDD